MGKTKHDVSWKKLLRAYLKKVGKQKTASTKSMLGYDSMEFKSHIEALWYDGMDWDNCGEWYIDHIVPIHCFAPETPVCVVNALQNLRPMWKNRQERTTDPRPCTIFLDIDGCILKHQGSLGGIILNEAELLPGVRERFDEWEKKGYNIILTTGRKESLREITEKHLRSFGLFWNQLIMGLGGGHRVLINDLKEGSSSATATAINLKRDAGLGSSNVENAMKIQSLPLMFGIDFSKTRTK